MSATRAPGASSGKAEGGVGGGLSLRASLWLAGQEIKRSWPSYPATGVIMAIFGLLVAGSVGDSLGSGASTDWNDSLPLDFLFLVWGSFLATNFISREHFASWSDSFSRRLAFLRALPISIQSVVAGRMLGAMPTLLFTVPAFFLPIYLLSEIGIQLSPISYIWFAGMWMGYGLLWSGLWTYLEFGLRGKTWNLLIISAVFPLMMVIGLLEWAAELRIVWRTLELVRGYGPLSALLSLAAGLASSTLLSRATVRRIERRDLSV